MTPPAIGRNAPCPCGSGKKYKHCCLGKAKGTVSSESAASPSASLQQALQSRQFNSLEEVQAFIDQHTQQQNRRPLDEFHGLSPEQMYQMLNFPFTSPELARFPEVLDVDPTAPALKLFNLLADAISEQGLKPTAKGNLPRATCREVALAFWGESTYQEQARFSRINKEEDFGILHTIRLVAELAGLVRKYKGRFILSRDCRRLLAEKGLPAVFPRLLRTYVEQFNWAYRDGYTELPFIQSSFLFTLYLLSRYGDIWRPQTFYEDAFLRAFPQVLEEVSPISVHSAEETLRNAYTWRTLVHFVDFFGLAAVEPVSDKLLCREYGVKALPLLDQAVRFKITNPG